MTTKSCFKCNCIKPLSEFYKHREMADGHLNKCKECAKKDVRDHRHGSARARILAYDKQRAHLPHRASLRRQVVGEYIASFPERRKANNAVNNAVRDGRLHKENCVVCGDSKSVAHHPDYSRPLDVVWLCQAHHKQEHARLDLLAQSYPSMGMEYPNKLGEHNELVR